MITFTYTEEQLVCLFHGRPETAYSLDDAPVEFIRDALAWNDANADLDGLDRATLLEIFHRDFLQA